MAGGLFRSVRMVALASALSATVPLAAQQPAREQVANGLVANLNRDTPKQFGMGVVVVRARAESGSVVLDIDVPAGFLSNLAPGEFDAFILQGFCRGTSAPAFFATGARMRFDVRQGNSPDRSRGAEFDHCPSQER